MADQADCQPAAGGGLESSRVGLNLFLFNGSFQKSIYCKGVNKDAWGDAVIFVALSDGDLDKAKIKYLEGRFYEIALEAKRFVVKNGNTPKKSKLSSQNITAMENLIRKAKLVLPTTGYNVFTAKSTSVKAPKVKPQPRPEKKQCGLPSGSPHWLLSS